jgi:hypothetical protein
MTKNFPLPETITIWHTSPVENLASILKHGITMAKFDIEKPLEIINNAKRVAKWRKKEAKDRLLESFQDDPSGYVCCSGDKAYSIQNGCASQEWDYYLTKKDYHSKRVCFKIVIPYRMIQIHTPKRWKNIMDRFEELWLQGYWARRMWEHKLMNIKYNNFTKCSNKPMNTNPIETYDHIVLQFVQPEFIESFEIIEAEKP